MAEDTKPAAAPNLKEIATIERDVNHLFFGQVLLNTDDTLLTRGQGKGLKIYDELRRDALAGAVLDKREFAVIARPWDVTPASQSFEDEAAAAMVRANIKTLQFDRICRELLDATLKGFAVGEVMWGVRDENIVALDVIPRNQRRFVFDLKSRAPRLITRENIAQGVELPERKFIVHTVGGKEGLPYGRGVGSWLFWPVLFKRKDISFWLIFADKFGSPTAVGKYPQGTTLIEQNKLLDALRAIAQDAGLIFPIGMEVGLLEATRAGSIDTYEKLARYMDEQISVAVLGETMTSIAQAGGLGSNQAGVHNDVRKELAQADADLLSDTLNSTLVKWLVDYNNPGAGYPKLYRKFEDQIDLNARAGRDVNIKALGYEPDQNYITETYGPGWRKRDA
jgi:phage gp29-like protein